MRSKVVQELLDDMEKDPWYIKLKRWFSKYWDKTYEYWIFKKKNKSL